MKKIILISLVLPIMAFGSRCKLVNLQCSDTSPTKTISGITFTLAEACSRLGLTGDNCCWSSSSKFYCSDSVDRCLPYRKNPNCYLINNTCLEKDYISGQCQKFQSKFSCASAYSDIESKVCTNVVCANNESGTAAKCFNPKQPTLDNGRNMASAIAYLQIAQNMAQDLHCADLHDPSNCTLFSGKYFSCYMYAFRADQPGSWNNNGADCMVNPEFFTQAGVTVGYKAADRKIYSQATAASDNVIGSSMSYALTVDNPSAINNSVRLHQDSNSAIVNQDQNISYHANNSNNPNLALNNGQVASVNINMATLKDLSGLTAFKTYLSDNSVNLAWNRQKAEPDPQHIKSITFHDEGISRHSSGQPFGWHSEINQPIINGLCVHFADSCEGGDNDATSSDLIKGELAWAGGFTNPNFCAKCTFHVPGLNTCLSGEPRQVLQQWCCFNSKIALDINLAAYDQGLINIYTGGDRYTDQIMHNGGICGGVTVGMISKIDFSKGNYFKDLLDSMDTQQIIDNSNFTNGEIQNRTQTRAADNAMSIINEWHAKGD